MPPSATYQLPTDTLLPLGYDAGAVLRDVTLAEARSWDCNSCGDCCDSSRPDVREDGKTSLPLMVWGSNLPDDRYAGRFGGEAMIVPLVPGDGELVPGDDFIRDADGKPYTMFRCRFLEETGDPDAPTRCAEYTPRTPGVERRPRNCGDFPVFGLLIDDAIIDHGYFIPPTGALPRCTWYGIRIVGPWKQSPGWQAKFDEQRKGWN